MSEHYDTQKLADAEIYYAYLQCRWTSSFSWQIVTTATSAASDISPTYSFGSGSGTCSRLHLVSGLLINACFNIVSTMCLQSSSASSCLLHTQNSQWAWRLHCWLVLYRQKASFTSRHVSYIGLMMCAGYMNKVPEEAMGNLQKCLNVAHSPIFSADFEQIYRQELRANGSKSSSTSSSRANSRGGTTSSRSGTTSSSSRNGTTKSPSGGWLRDLFSSSKRDDSATSSSNGARDVDVLVLDPMGYYSLLGLKPGNQVSNLM